MSIDRRPAREGSAVTPRRSRRPVRPLDDGTTEFVNVIGFVLQAGESIQPVLYLDRRLLD
jgi:hypothetical protein